MVKDGTADRGMVSLWGFSARSPAERATQIIERLLDLGEQRIRHMDETGIDKAILALTSPGAQPLLDVKEARGLAQRANDYLAAQVAAHRGRYVRSEEHTSELQSQSNLVCRLLLEKKKHARTRPKPPSFRIVSWLALSASAPVPLPCPLSWTAGI